MPDFLDWCRTRFERLCRILDEHPEIAAEADEVVCPGCHLPALYSDRYCADCKEFGTPKQRGEE